MTLMWFMMLQSINLMMLSGYQTLDYPLLVLCYGMLILTFSLVIVIWEKNINHFIDEAVIPYAGMDMK